MRNDIGYFLTSISSSTQQGWIIGVLSRATSGVAASASPELSGPQMMLTFWRCVSSATAFTALVGSLWVSRTISSILRPSMPPAALISSTARTVPRLMPTPVDELGPVSAGMKPILIGSLAAMAGLASPEASVTAPAADPDKTWRRLIGMSFPPKYLLLLPYSIRARGTPSIRHATALAATSRALDRQARAAKCGTSVGRPA